MGTRHEVEIALRVALRHEPRASQERALMLVWELADGRPTIGAWVDRVASATVRALVSRVYREVQSEVQYLDSDPRHGTTGRTNHDNP